MLNACVVPTQDGPRYMPARGETIVISMISIHRSKQLWGEDADVFDPERWIDGRAKETDYYRFLPFIAGPRYADTYYYVVEQSCTDSLWTS